MLLAGELLKLSKEFIEDGVHPTTINRGLRTACAMAKQKIRELSVTVASEYVVVLHRQHARDTTTEALLLAPYQLLNSLASTMY